MFTASCLASFLAVVSVGVSPDLGKKEVLPMPRIESEANDLTGYYTCKGQEAGGKNYSGIVTLVKKNDVYLATWVMAGGSNFSGIAMRNGNNLAASWTITTERGLVRGVNLYRIENGVNGPHLAGRWASVPGNGLQQQETLSFLKKMEVDE